MKLISNSKYIILLITVLSMLSCDDLAPFQDDEIITGWEYMQDKTEGSPLVTISDVLPHGTEAETAPILTIIGENFQANTDSVRVFFNSVEVTLISATETEIQCYRPSNSGDLTLKVACHDRINVAHYDLNIATVVSDFGIFANGEVISDITIDSDNNLYAALAADLQKIVKFEYPSEIRSAWEASLYDTEGFFEPTEIRINPSGGITYVANDNYVLRTGADGSSYLSNRVDTLANAITPVAFDFADNGDIYFGGGNNDAIHRVVYDIPDSVVFYDDFYKNYTINSIRVYNGYIYFVAKLRAGKAGAYGVYRNEILPDGSPGPEELVLNWESVRDSVDYELNDITFSETGVLYLGTSDPHEPLKKVVSGEVMGVFYDIISSPINKMEWGTDKYLYILSNVGATVGDGCIVQVVNVNELSAPYYGRE